MGKIKTQQELLEENKSLKLEIASLKNTNSNLQEYTNLLKESEEQFKAFANQATEGITVSDLEGNYVYVNPGFCKMSGYTEEELLALTVFDMNAKEEGPERFVESTKDKEGTVIFVQLQRKDKTEYTSEITGKIINIGGEKLVLGTIRDVTDRKLSEAKLKQNKSELLEAQRIGNLGNWSLDLINKKLTWSNQVYKIFGVEPDYKLAFDTIYDFIHPDDKELLDTVFDKSVKENKPYYLEFRIVLNDGSIKWVLEQGESEYDTDGNTIKVFGIVQDITKQKNANEKLIESENRFSAILENLKTGVIIHVDNEIVYVNDAILDMLGYANEPSVIGRDVFDFVHPEDQNIIIDAVKKSLKDTNVIKTRAEMSVEVRLIKKDGNIVLVKDTGVTINYYGKSARMVMVENITDRKIAEEKVKASELKYRSIFDSTPIAIWEEDFSKVKVLLDTLKKKGVKHYKKYFDEHPEFVQECANSVIIVDINNAAVQLHEASSKDDLVNNISDFFLPESFEAFKKELATLVKGEFKCELGTVVKTKSGAKKYVHLKFVVAPGYESNLSKIYISIQDITGLKQTQLNLLKNEKRLNEVLSIANLGSFVFYDSTDLFETSLIADEILGIDKLYKRDIEGWANLIYPEDLEKVRHFVDNIDIEDGAIEFRIVRPNDKKINWLLANIKKELDENGKRSKITGTFSDITESKQMTKTLEESENMLIETQQIAKIGSYVLNFSTGIWKSSLELDMIFGIPRNHKKDIAYWLDVIHPDDKEMMSECIETNIMLNHEFFNKEYRIVNAIDKETIWVHGMGALSFDDEGNLLTMKGTIQDITEAKTIREAFKTKNELLINLSAQIPGVIYQFLLRPDGTSCFPYSSVGIKGIYGVTPEQVLESAEPVFAVIHPDDLARVGEGVKKSGDNLSLWRDEYRVILPGNKEASWIEGYSIPKRLEDGSTLWHGLITNIDERKKAEKEIKFLSEITQQSKNAVLTANLDYEITWVNEAFIKLYGYTLEEVLGKSPIILSADFLAKDIQDEIYDSVSSGNKYKIESIDKKKDGTVFPVEIEVFPILDKEGQIFAYSSHIVDITDRKKKEKELLDSKQVAEENEIRFKALHNASFGGIAIHKKGLIIDCNQGLSKITGYSVDELIGMDSLLLIEESLRDFVRGRIAVNYEYPYEIVGVRKNKEVYPLRVEGKEIQYNGKKIRSVEFRDITDQKKAELDLQNANSLLYSIIESPENISMFALDLNLNYISFNQGYAAEMKNLYNVDIKIGKSPLDCLTGAVDIAIAKANYKRVLKGEQFSIIQEYGLKNKRFWYGLNFNPIRNSSDVITGFSAFVTNITERKQLDEELEKYREKLEELVKDRTKELQAKNSELDQAMKVFVGREMKIRALQKKIKELEN